MTASHRASRLRWYAPTALGVVALLTLSACGSSGEAQEGDGDITLTFQWWGNEDRASATEAVVDLYMSKNPGITIETSFAPDAAYWEKMATQVAGGNPPDIFQMKLEYLKEYAGRGVIADLSEYTSGPSPAIRTEAMQDQYLAAGQVDGKTYGIPTGRSTQSVVYDPAAWSELGLDAPSIGWTWDDLAAAGEAVTAASGGTQAVMSDIGNEQAWFEAWLLQRGKSIYTDEGELNFTEDDLVEFWTFTSGLAADGVFTPAKVTTANDWSMANSPLVKSSALSEFNHVSLASAYFESFGAVALAPLPADSDSVSLGSYAGATQLLSVAEKSKHPEESAAFVDFFLNDPEAGKLLGLVRGMPVNQDVLADLAATFTEGDLATFEFEQLMAEELVAKPPVAPSGGSQSLLDFKNTYDRIIFEQESVTDAAKSMYAKYQKNLS